MHVSLFAVQDLEALLMGLKTLLVPCSIRKTIENRPMAPLSSSVLPEGSHRRRCRPQLRSQLRSQPFDYAASLLPT